jgi:hypothetical protein
MVKDLEVREKIYPECLGNKEEWVRSLEPLRGSTTTTLYSKKQQLNITLCYI